MMEREALLLEALRSLPPAAFAFGYGSGVMRQADSRSSEKCASSVTSPVDNKVLDFILAVDDAEEWHRQNIEQWGNASHYSWVMQSLGPRAISRVQQSRFGARIYYNALVPLRRQDTAGFAGSAGSLETLPLAPPSSIPCARAAQAQNSASIPASNAAVTSEDSAASTARPAGLVRMDVQSIEGRSHSRQLIKYGVITVRHLLDDLRHWESLYVAGRMHKPVQVLQSNPLVELANEQNIENAARAALITLPEEFDEEQIYEAVASLSYVGDVRRAVGAEDPAKTRKIVHGNFDGFRALYSPILTRLDRVITRKSGASTRFQQAVDAASREQLMLGLPLSFLSRAQMASWQVSQTKTDWRSRMRGLQMALNANKEGVIQAFEKTSHLAPWQSLSKAELGRRLAQAGPQASKQAVLCALGSIIRGSSLRQTIKGALTAGLVRSVQYASAKFAKGFGANWRLS
ncbi:Phosphatidate cytidylyltransferase, mitochondrial [Porphyridium purpureum]|uniref:Phosphatidate cytidylyltransferase, mitochondrial n=1 Tax=Porphyridium purpureum TaxID=35688 RepID=A0A5J4Z837_PORPP|nr:Phosphatidate cytidylyltransferase, mitochondrial [Porphyridium purpureum]|eukprot:POR4953..scf295_1